MTLHNDNVTVTSLKMLLLQLVCISGGGHFEQFLISTLCLQQ